MVAFLPIDSAPMTVPTEWGKNNPPPIWILGAISIPKKNKFNEDIGVISALTVMNDLRPIITEYFKKTGEQQHNVVRAIFAYVSSRSPLSSPFVIAKD